MRSIARNKYFLWIYLLLIVPLFYLGWQRTSYFIIACSVCAAWFAAVQSRLVFLQDKDNTVQMKSCKPVGFLMLIPAVGIIAAGILLFRPDEGLSNGISYYAIALPALLTLCLSFQILAFWKDKSLAARLLRLTIWAAMSASLSLVVVLSLYAFVPEEAAAMSCMSAVVFGAIGLLIALNIILISCCGYKSTKESVQKISGLIKQNKLVFTRVSILKDAFLVAGKSAISFFSLSFFMFVNALYSAGMGIARFIAVAMHKQDAKKKIASYRIIGIILSSASICYVLYSIRLFFGGQTGVYDMNVALVIALYTFVEFGINIREAVRLRKSNALEAKALRAISFSSTLICFVLTQTAILSFAAEGDNSFVNALSGVVFGALAALVGLYVIIDSFSHKKASEKR